MAKKPHLDRYRVKPNAKVRLDEVPTHDDGGMEKQHARERMVELGQRLAHLQEVMYAQGKHSLLVVLQAMDAGGKDSTLRHVLEPINPQGCKVISFKAPNSTELGHDFLWRVHQNVPRLGYIGVFNRSHYEDVLIARVKNLVPAERWKRRYDHIRAFEQMLVDEGTAIVKFFLHISKDYQKQRLQRRLGHPDKWWKFNPADLVERALWDDYQHAYTVALQKTSTKQAPWYVIPAECRWYRDLLVTEGLVQTLEALDMEYPKANFDPAQVVIE